MKTHNFTYYWKELKKDYKDGKLPYNIKPMEVKPTLPKIKKMTKHNVATLVRAAGIGTLHFSNWMSRHTWLVPFQFNMKGLSRPLPPIDTSDVIY